MINFNGSREMKRLKKARDLRQEVNPVAPRVQAIGSNYGFSKPKNQRTLGGLLIWLDTRPKCVTSWQPSIGPNDDMSVVKKGLHIQDVKTETFMISWISSYDKDPPECIGRVFLELSTYC